MKAHVIEWPCLTPKDIADALGISKAMESEVPESLRAEVQAILDNEEVKTNESTSVGNTGEENKS